MAISCNPSDLIREAKCFGCLTPKQLQAVRTRLICEWGNQGGEPTPDPLLDSLEYYPLDGTVLWYDRTKRVWTEHLHTRNPNDQWEQEIIATGGPYAINVGGGTLSGDTYTVCYHLSPDGKFTGKRDSYVVGDPGDVYDIAIDPIVQSTPASQLWIWQDFVGGFIDYFIVPPAGVAAGYTFGDYGTDPFDWAAFISADFLGRGIELALWPQPDDRDDPPNGVSTVIPFFAGYDASATQAFVSSGDTRGVHRGRWDMLYFSGDPNPLYRTYGIVFAPEEGLDGMLCGYQYPGPGGECGIYYADLGGGSLSIGVEVGQMGLGPVTPVVPFTPGDWYLVVARYDGLLEQIKVDVWNLTTGLHSTSSNAIGATPAFLWDLWAPAPLEINNLAGSLSVGGGAWNVQPFYGSIDRFYLWQRLLTDGEVLGVYNAGLVWAPAYSM